MRFHLKANGEPGVCTARKSKCPLGGDHFGSLEEAAGASERLFEAEVGPAAAVKLSKSKASPKTVVIGKHVHGVVDDDDESSFFCKSCKKRFAYDGDYDNILLGNEVARCPCGESSTLGTDNLLVQSTNLWLLDKTNFDDEENMLYHITARPTWREDIEKEAGMNFHFGDRLATQYRVNDLMNMEEAKPPFYLHRVRLRSDTPASLTLVDDMGADWADLKNSSKDITVYLNLWENPGSLSAMTGRENFEFLGEPEELSEDEARL
jgi:hypothetical protein